MTEATPDPFSKDALLKMKEALAKEHAAFTKQGQEIESAMNLTRVNLQRIEGAMVVVDKLLAPPAPPDAGAKPDKGRKRK